MIKISQTRPGFATLRYSPHEGSHVSQHCHQTVQALAEATARHCTDLGALRAIGIGKRWRICDADLAVFLKTCESAPRPQQHRAEADTGTHRAPDLDGLAARAAVRISKRMMTVTQLDGKTAIVIAGAWGSVPVCVGLASSEAEFVTGVANGIPHVCKVT